MINEYENLLRTIIIELLGSDSMNYNVSEDRIAKWQEKKIEEIKKNNGLCLEDRIIYYSDFYDIETIISKNWNIFKPVFYDKKRFDVFFKEISDYRNTVAHGRNLIKSQLLLIEGILMDLKNQKTIYHNKNEMKEDYFIRIDRVSDNLGNIWASEIAGKRPMLRVGDDYELIIEAHDPKGREIEYEIRTVNRKFKITQKENRFNFKIPASLIKQSQPLLVGARTPYSEYENRKHLTIIITVLPQEQPPID